MRISRPDGSGFLEGLDAEGLVRAAFSDKIDEALSCGTITASEARVLRRIGRFQAVRFASHGDRNLYQDSETGDFWELKEGAVVRLVGVDESGIAKEAVVRAAGGSTGYYRSKRMEQNPGTFNDGAGEKGVGKFAEGDEDEDDEDIETESATGMQPDVYYQNKPYNRDEGPGHAQTAATEPFKKDEWLVSKDTGDEYQVAVATCSGGGLQLPAHRIDRNQALAGKVSAAFRRFDLIFQLHGRGVGGVQGDDRLGQAVFFCEPRIGVDDHRNVDGGGEITGLLLQFAE